MTLSTTFAGVWVCNIGHDEYSMKSLRQPAESPWYSAISLLLGVCLLQGWILRGPDTLRSISAPVVKGQRANGVASTVGPEQQQRGSIPATMVACKSLEVCGGPTAAALGIKFRL